MNWWVMLPTAAGVVVGVIGYLMNRSILEMDEKIDKANIRIDEISVKLDQSNAHLEKVVNDLWKEFYDYKDKATDEFVKKTDFVHVTSDIGKKLDRVYDILLDLKGKVH
ncbi:hypothetical protein Dtox_4223 [Desulfofarcimen acetoxidans DSM 771]|uniref:Uncharacterized protein n=1 Tax=Desulfofarcimen acetoxidans (strain ATCC 49208 / DSM 771 / KCTC 5769 / VKM B-1644 / 5575) TaxID=485916 RepID=C8VZE5_DESAS|nr:hypothetical protein [Desulfofarcimen acetoxidans]ACV64890.1 hypothetical protein Dtox_4223 [Desulfofarcimen acetoxidans DSM 771]